MRSWRTRWRGRLRLVGLGLVAGLVLLVATRAHADWQTNVSMPVDAGVPNKFVEVWGQGIFSVGTPTEAVLFLDGGTSTRTIPGTSAGTYYEASTECFLSIWANGGGDRRSISNKSGLPCSSVTSEPIATESARDIVRVRQATGGGAAALSNDSDVYFADAGIYSSTTFGRRTNAQTFFYGPLGVVRVGDTLYALAANTSDNAVVYWSADRKAPELLDQSVPGAGKVQTIDLYTPDNVEPHAVIGTDRGAFLRGSLGSGMAVVQTLDGGFVVNSLTMNVEAGGAYGHGFGMAVVAQSDGGSSTVMSAVPMLDAGQAGTRWVFRSLPPEFAGAPLKEVSCSGASYCVVTADRSTNNLFIYTNDAGPVISNTVVELGESEAGQFTFTATDPDGDPVLLSLVPLDGVGVPWSVEQVDAGVAGGWRPGDPLVVKVTSSPVCADLPVGDFKVHASDGLAAHDTEKTFSVLVKHTRKPDVPSVSTPSTGLVAGRSDPWRMEVDGGVTATGCVLTGFSWSTDAGTSGPSLREESGGRVAVLTAPATLCAAGGADFPFSLTVTDDAGLTNSQEFKVHVAPWGHPNAAFDGGVLNLTAGDSVVIAPDLPRHACETSSGFPGVETTWTLVGSPVPAQDITFRKTDTGEVVSAFPVTAPELRVESRQCIGSTRLTLSATNLVRTPDGVFPSAPTVREVNIPTDVLPIDKGVLQLTPTPLLPDPVVEVGLGASQLNCFDERGLVADLRLERLDGGVVAREAVAFSSGKWVVDTGTRCAGGTFRVAGSLKESAGGRTAETAVQVELPRVDAALEPVPEGTALVARCGEGASATLTQTLPKDACQRTDITWSRVSGPELTQDSLSGATVSLATRNTGLDELVGQSVVMQVTANAGPGNEATLQQVLPITVEPFIRVKRRTEVPAASDTGLVGVSITLSNTTACGVKDVSFVERLQGLTYVEGSAQFDGQPLEASWVDGVLTVKGLSLEGNGSGRLTYVARPHLVGERRMEGEAQLREVPISISETPGPQVPDSGCGCTSSGPGPVLLALGALVAAVRRRRR